MLVLVYFGGLVLGFVVGYMLPVGGKGKGKGKGKQNPLDRLYPLDSNHESLCCHTRAKNYHGWKSLARHLQDQHGYNTATLKGSNIMAKVK